MRRTSFLGVAAIAAIVLFTLTSTLQAEVVATGQFNMEFAPVLPPPPGTPNPYTGTIVFDNQSFDVQGTPVNLGLEVGTMNMNGSITVDVGGAESGTAEYSAVSASAGLLSFDSDGAFVCEPGGGCVSPENSNFTGFLSSVTGSLVGTILPLDDPVLGIYVSDGFVGCVGNLCSGLFSVNFIAADPTPTGTDVGVVAESEFYNTETEQAESLSVVTNFDSVSVAGDTYLVPLSDVLGEIPVQFEIEADGYRAALFDLATTATFSGTIEVCWAYADDDNDGVIDGTTLSETSLRLLHNEGGTFVDRTSSQDIVANQVCGEVTSFSEFAVVVDPTPVVSGSCPAAPQPICTVTAQAKLDYNEKSAGKEKMKLQWKKIAAETTQADYGDPVGGSTSVALCIYDDLGALVQGLIVDQAGQSCAGKDCWKAKGTKGYGYKDKDNASNGVSKIGYGSGDATKGKADAKGKNNSTKGQLSLPTGVVQMLTGNVAPTIQMVTSDGFCVGATMTEVKKDDGVSYKAQKK